MKDVDPTCSSLSFPVLDKPGAVRVAAFIGQATVTDSRHFTVSELDGPQFHSPLSHGQEISPPGRDQPSVTLLRTDPLVIQHLAVSAQDGVVVIGYPVLAAGEGCRTMLWEGCGISETNSWRTSPWLISPYIP